MASGVSSRDRESGAYGWYDENNEVVANYVFRILDPGHKLILPSLFYYYARSNLTPEIAIPGIFNESNLTQTKLKLIYLLA